MEGCSKWTVFKLPDVFLTGAEIIVSGDLVCMDVHSYTHCRSTAFDGATFGFGAVLLVIRNK